MDGIKKAHEEVVAWTPESGFDSVATQPPATESLESSPGIAQASSDIAENNPFPNVGKSPVFDSFQEPEVKPVEVQAEATPQAEVVVSPSPEEIANTTAQDNDLAQEIVGSEAPEPVVVPEKVPFVESSLANEIQEAPVEMAEFSDGFPESDPAGENNAKVEAVEEEVRGIMNRAREAFREIDEAIEAIKANDLLDDKDFKELEARHLETRRENRKRIENLNNSKAKIKALLGEEEAA